MRPRTFLSSLWLGAWAALGSLALACTSGPPLEVASGVDLSRFQGQWYEIAKLPRLTESDCYGTAAFYSLHDDGSLDLVNQCHQGGMAGPLLSVTMGARVPDPKTPAKLAIDVGGFYGDYWILEVGPRYEYAVVGHPSRLYLWVLSRAPVLDADTMSGIVARAQGNGFDTSALVSTPQDPGSVPSGVPSGDVAPAKTYGCSAARFSGPSPAVLPFGGLLLLGLAGRSRRRRAPPR